MPSLTTRSLQALLRFTHGGNLPRDQAALSKIRRTAARDPAPGSYRGCVVEVHDKQGFPVFAIRPRGDAPVRRHILYFHGGGYVNPPSFLHWWFVVRLAKALDAEVTVPRYPLAPEHKCDESIAFAGDIYRGLAEREGADKLLVMGDSAGGGLALAVLQHTAIMPAGLVLNAPWLDASVCDPSQVEIERGEWLLNRVMLRGWGRYWAGARDLQDPMVSPLFGDLSILPPTLMFCGSTDILVADARRLTAAAPDKVRYIEEEGLMHVYPLLPLFPEAKRAWREIVEFAKQVLPLHPDR